MSCTFYSRYWIRKEKSLKKSPSKEKRRGFEQITIKPERLVGVEVYFPSGLKIILRDLTQQDMSSMWRRYFLFQTVTDIRKGNNGLNVFKQKDVFLFLNKRRDRIKLLMWDRTGYAMYYKQLEKVTFELPLIKKIKGYLVERLLFIDKL